MFFEKFMEWKLFFCDFRDFAGDFIIFWPHCDESKDNNDHGLRFETKKNGCNYRDGADNLFSRVEAQLDEISYVGVSLACCPLAGQAELFIQVSKHQGLIGLWNMWNLQK